MESTTTEDGSEEICAEKDSGDAPERAECDEAVGLASLIGYRWIAKMRWSTARQVATAWSAIFACHVIVAALIGVTDMDLYLMYAGNGFIGGAYYCVPILLLPFIQQRVEGAFPDAEGLAELRERLRPRAGVYLPIIVFGVVALFAGYSITIEETAGVRAASTNLFAQDMGLAVLMYVVVPVQAVLGGLFLGALVTCTRYLYGAASALPIDVYRLDPYGCFSLLPVFVFCAWSTILGSVGLIGMRIEDAEVGALVIGLVFFGIAVLALTLAPVFRMQARLGAALDDARHEALRDLDPDDGDRLIRMMYLESRSSWPIGAGLRRLLVFGALPPAAWILAATLENLLYG